MPDVALQHISKVFGSGAKAVTAVDDVSLTVRDGEFFFLLGPSGCGKTTVLRIIAGLTGPTEGRIYFGSEDITERPVDKRGTALVFQNYALWPHMSVAENVSYGPRVRGVPRALRRRTAEENLERVRMMSCRDRKPTALSGGQQQRVALARALAAAPACLLLDEPLSNLDAQLRLEMRDEIRDLVKNTGITAVYVTHDQKEALSMADRIAVFNDGRVVQVATPHDLYEHPETPFVASFIGETNLVGGRVVAIAHEGIQVETDLGLVFGVSRRPVHIGDPVTICVRPEKIVLRKNGRVEHGEEPGTMLSARLERSIYLGDTVQHRCRVRNGDEWKVAVAGDTPARFAEGEAVSLMIPPQAASVLV